MSAGPDLTVSNRRRRILQGTANDDGYPNPPGFTTETWSLVSGPGTATFADSTAAETTAAFSEPGTYVLRLSSSDSALTVADDVTVEVGPASETNVAPSVFAGSGPDGRAAGLGHPERLHERRQPAEPSRRQHGGLDQGQRTRGR